MSVLRNNVLWRIMSKMLHIRRMNRKGSVEDIILIAIICLFVAIIGIVVIKFMGMMNTQIQAKTDVPQVAKDVSSAVTARLPKWLDSAFIFIYVMLIIVAFVFAMLVDTNPVFLVITFIYTFFLVIISKICGSIWTALIADATLAADAASLPIISFMMPRLHIFSFVAAISILIIMVSKRGNA